MNFFKSLTVVAAFALTACSSNESVAQERYQAGSAANCTVELNGDSVLFGFVDNGTTWRHSTTPAKWLRNSAFTVTDRTAGGLSTYNLVRGYLKPFPEAWPELYPAGAQPAFWNTSHDSKIIVIQTGINDMKPEFYDYNRVLNDYRWLVDHIRSMGKIPVLTGVTQVSAATVGAQQFLNLHYVRQAMNQVVQEKQVHYANFDNTYVEFTDGIHLTQASSNGIADNLRYVVKYICML